MLAATTAPVSRQYATRGASRLEAQMPTANLAQCRSTPRAAACGAAAVGDYQSAAPDVEAVVLKNGVVDYYSVLQVDDDSPEDEIKAAYRQLAKVCHPDFTGDAGHNICILLNEAYDTLMNSKARKAYDTQLEVALKDEEDGFTAKAISKWGPDSQMKNRAKNEDPNETRAVFVDENSCIGCMNCIFTAPATFRMNHDHGRARVFAQWLNTEEELDTAVLSCPVDCIHWVERSELPALEYVCQNLQTRVNVAMLMTSRSGGDVFGERDMFLKGRRKLEERKRKAAATASPLQEEARKKAAEALARKRGGWWGSFSHSLKESFKNAAAGVEHNDRDQHTRVGARKRTVNWREAMEARGQSFSSVDSGDDSDGGATIPVNLALVPIMAPTLDDLPQQAR